MPKAYNFPLQMIKFGAFIFCIIFIIWFNEYKNYLFGDVIGIGLNISEVYKKRDK